MPLTATLSALLRHPFSASVRRHGEIMAALTAVRTKQDIMATIITDLN